MTETSEGRFKQSLGIGDIISETFSILMSNILSVLVLSCVPTLIALLFVWLLIGASFLTGGFEQDPEVMLQSGLTFINIILAVVLMFSAYGITVALLVQMAYDFKLGRPVQPTRYILPAFASVPYIVLLMILVGFAIGFGFVFFIVPGLWIYAVFSVFVPAILFDRAGFGALGRSMRLTKEYRWPIVGLTLIMWVIGILVSEGGSLIVGLIPGGFVIDIILLAILYGITYGISGISVALIYARLREIKEGGSLEDVVSVFE